LLRNTADSLPEKALLIARDEQLSFGQADHQAGALAASLKELGVRQGDRVALVLDNVPQYPVACYGILKAGAAVLPLCADTRSTTLTRALAHGEARAVILGGRNTRLLEGTGGELPDLRAIISVGKPQVSPRDGVNVVEFDQLLSGKPMHDESTGDSALAAIMYTSGTTSLPKGVMLSHRNLLSNTRSIVEYLELSSEERVGLVLPFFYSYGTSVLHTHIAVGGTIVVLGSVAFPAAILQGIEQYGCTGLPGVPSTFAKLIHFQAFANYNLSSIRYLTQAGGPMTPALTRKLMQARPQAKIYVMYGQTEASPRLTYLPPSDLERKLGSVGIPIPGVSLAVVDQDGTSCPPGVQGELVARGDNIMLGYWKDEAETKRALRPEGLRTGDLARADEDGYFYIIGRNNDMIKAGAHRISPQEIEAAVERLPAVSKCGVVGIPDELLGEAIAAFVLPIPGAELSENEVMRACFEQLPRFKMPQHVLIVDHLPTTDTGKVRRSELKTWFGQLGASRSS
jgi:acyl-CoA synthetase (AMP-forming)/AMP-acid ligase II